ncbi:3137_t:CDS:2 [Cetraspora pellucida]|uniref:3137_t:CDS:1 n=1 Tax=Cetraspora pellucida TaxID=1433469 RepID=A0A9N9D1Z7_9GLOM|nr:3137_t:CDS:2 [Cetraspora pellucida]
MNNQFKLGFCYEKNIGTSKDKEKASDIRNSVKQISNNFVEAVSKVSTNAAAQKKAANEITIAKKKITEFKQIYSISTDSQFKHDIYIKISNLQTQIRANKDRIAKLKKKMLSILKIVSVPGVSHTNTHEHPNGHYCFASVKCAKQFASVFSNMLVVICQDDKAKIGFEIPAVGQTFYILQSINNPICIADHNFVIGFEQKLVLSVYLLMKLDESNDEP